MLKTVLYDYKKRWRDALKNAWVSAPGAVLYLVVSGQALFQGRVLLFAVIPLFAGLLLSRMYPNQMDMTQLLLPMSGEERKKYVRTGFALRIGISLFPYLFLEGILLVTGELRMIWFCGMLIVEMCNLAAVNLYFGPAAADKTAAKKGPSAEYLAVWEVCMQLFSVAALVMFSSAQKERNPVTTFDAVIMLCVLSVVVLIFLRVMYRYYIPVMEQAVRK